MRKIVKFISVFLFFILLFSVVFYLWAQMPNYSSSEYSKIDIHKTGIQKSDSSLHILTYNLGYLSGMTNNLSVKPTEEFYNNNMHDLIINLKHTDADIIAFQEIDFNSNRSYNVNQNNYIADSLYSYSASCVNWDKKYVPYPYWPLKANFGSMLSGQSVLSKYELSDQQRIVLDKVESDPFFYKAFYLDRLAQLVLVKHPVSDFYLINIHVEAFDQQTRIKQLKHILKLFKEKAKLHPVILLGDFNSDLSYENSAMKMFFDEETMSCAAVDTSKFENTYPSDNAYERLDYVFYSKKDFKFVNCKVLKQFKSISDHIPFYTTLKFSK